MALGTPVIATGYSGTFIFMTPANSLLVDWHETYVGPGSRVYPAHGHWAEPDLDHAAAMLREAWESPARRPERALRARQDIEHGVSPACGRAGTARSRLELLAAGSRGGQSAERIDLALGRIEQALAIDPAAGAGGGRRELRGVRCSG